MSTEPDAPLPLALCRDCLARFTPPAAPPRCPECGGPRLLIHPELDRLSIAHIDCDSFYAAVEKRDDPSLADRPLIIGGGRRGVVSTACYIARIRGVRSAMPMFKALRLCPDAVVLRPRMTLYASVGRQIREMMRALTPLVEPLSLDEAFLDLTGTGRLHGTPAAATLAALILRIERDVGVTASVGLSHNKFLAKVASDLEKPRGFSIIGRAETDGFLIGQPVSLIWGVGAALRARLERDGLRTLRDLRRIDEAALIARYGVMGSRLAQLARGEDSRRVTADGPMKSISTETTFDEDLSDREILDGWLWRLGEQVSSRAKARDIVGRVVTVKLKRADHRQLTRRISLETPTNLADTIYRTATPLLEKALGEAPFRLIGVGLSDLSESTEAAPAADLFDPAAGTRAAAERASDRIRARYGAATIRKGRSLR